MIFPVGDDNDEGHSRHHHDFVHYGIILLCLCMFIYECYLILQPGQALRAFIERWSFDPKTYLGNGFLKQDFAGRSWTLLKCFADLRNGALGKAILDTFIHGSPAHLFGNMLLLWMLGDNVEYAMGHLRYFLFYILSAVLATFGATVLSTYANFNGGIGASGAIMAVAGAYLVYFPKAKINFFYLIFFFWGIVGISARLVIGAYALGDMTTAYHGYGTDYGKIGVWAHVFGFTFGVLLAFFFKRNLKEPLRQPGTRRPYNKSALAALRERRENKHLHADDDHWQH